MRTVYAYRRLYPEDEVDNLLNQAWDRGWEVHTFTPDDEGGMAAALFQKRDGVKSQKTPFEKGEEDED